MRKTKKPNWFQAEELNEEENEVFKAHRTHEFNNYKDFSFSKNKFIVDFITFEKIPWRFFNSNPIIFDLIKKLYIFFV